MRIRIRLLIIIVVILVAALLIVAAGMAGRSTTPKLAVVQISELQTAVVTYGLVDLDRGLFMQQSIDVSGFRGSNFDHVPPLVLQSARNGDTIMWTLNALDVWSGALTPEMRIETVSGDYLNAARFRQEAGDRWIYHDFTPAELYYTRPGQLEAQFAQVAPIGSAFWSNDFTRFAVGDAGIISITNTETGETDVIIEGAGPAAVVRWSPDDRYIAVSSDTTGQVIDVESRQIVLEIEGDGLRWCDDRLIYTADTDDGIFEARLYDLETGTEEILFTRDRSDLPVWERTLTVAGLDNQPCAWLLVYRDVATIDLVHIDSSRVIPLGGTLIMPYHLADGALTYLVEDGQKTELRRIVLDPATEAYEVLASLDGLSTSLTWIDDARGAVYLRNGQLRRIDPVTDREMLLPGVEIQTFSIMP